MIFDSCCKPTELKEKKYKMTNQIKRRRFTGKTVMSERVPMVISETTEVIGLL